MATIYYARLLAELGHHEDCERTLKEGVASGFVPAHFWLGWCRYQQSKTTKVRREVRDLLEYAAEKGHPAANVILARWMAVGSFGLHNIPHGWMLLVQMVVSSAFATSRDAPA